MSGKTANLAAVEDESIERLQERAQIALGVGKGRLLGPSGCPLGAKKPRLTEIGANLLFHVRTTEICGRGRAFAVLLGDGSVTAFGRRDAGGDCSAVQDRLKSIRCIQATEDAFAAVVDDGSVVTWGRAGRGGDSVAVQGHLVGVTQIQATSSAFAALLVNGSVITWGDQQRGGNSCDLGHAKLRRQQR